MGTANKLDATKFEITDISKTHTCPLARVMRKELRDRGIASGVEVLYSTAKPVYRPVAAQAGEKPVPGSISYVPPVARTAAGRTCDTAVIGAARSAGTINESFTAHCRQEVQNAMKKKLTVILILVLILLMVAGAAILINQNFYNRTIIDLTYAYDRAIIQLPNGEIVDGRVESWTDYADGDQIQVKINGKVYLVHSANVALIKD